MSDGQLHQAPDMANGSVLNKSAVEAQMNRLEAMDISPSVQAVRAHMGGATARVGALVTEINGERDAVVEAAITEELSKTAKKLHHLARDSAKRVFAADLRVMSSELERIKADHCWRRPNFEPPGRPNIEPGVEADFERAGCG